MLAIKDASPIDCEIALMNRIYGLWSVIYKNSLKELHHTIHSDPALFAQKAMMNYIQDHYSESISLNEIAASGNIGRSKCCILFKKYLDQSPNDFLNAYRLKKSCSMLTKTNTKITEISVLCGFHHPSYFPGNSSKHMGVHLMSIAKENDNNEIQFSFIIDRKHHHIIAKRALRSIVIAK